MSDLVRNCPECGAPLAADSPTSLCPHCLVQLGFGHAADDAPAAAPAQTQLAVSETVITSLPGLTKIRYFGDYELLSELAHGGMGVVFKARQVSLKRVVALKMILSGSFASKDFVQRFYAEAEAAARLDHLNIVPIYEIGQHEGQHYFSMKLIEGFSLAQELQGKPWAAKRAAELIAKVARAVHYAHQRGILHRDIKPGNILIDAKGEPYVTDFGLAKIAESGTDVTQTNAVMGSPAYMSPEQASGQTKNLTTAADVYSLGAVFYELLTGRPPFQGESALDIMQQVVGREPISPQMIQSQIDRDLETICLKCLEKEPVRRYGSAEALADDLERWLRHEPIIARPSTAWERTRKWGKRNPKIAALASAFLLVIAIGSADSFWLWRRAERHARNETQQRLRADSERARAEAERQRAEASDRESRRHLYAANLNLAQQAWEQNNVGRVRQLLEETATYPERGFEWYYWQRQTHLELKTLHGHLLPIRDVAFSPDSQRIVTGSSDQTAKVWEANSGKDLLTFKKHRNLISSVAFSPDGQRILTGSADQTAKLWEALNGEEVLTLKGHSAAIWAVAFSPDGQRIATASSDQSAKVWETASGRELLTLEGHNSAVASAAFSPDGQRIITSSVDETAKLWETASGKELLTFKGHTGSLYCVAFSPDGQQIVTGSDDQTAKL